LSYFIREYDLGKRLAGMLAFYFFLEPAAMLAFFIIFAASMMM
jgi:hypothetical protein